MTAEENKSDELTELILEIQGGDREKMSVLWASVEKFIQYAARRRFHAVGNFGGCEIEDLVQAGYIALDEAVEMFDPSRGAGFITFLSMRLKAAFAEAAGINTAKRDALLYASSLDVPVDDENPAGDTLLDMQPAPGDMLEESEARLYIEDIHRAIETALESLQPVKREIIRQHYFEGRTLQEIASDSCRSAEAIRQQEQDALKKLRRECRKNGLDQFVEAKVDEETDFYRPSGVGVFKRTGYSSVEQTYLQRERIRAEVRKKYTVIPGR